MKRFSFLIMALIMLFVSCETYEEQNARLTYEVKEAICVDKYTDKEIAMLIANDTDVLYSYIEKVEVEE